MFEKVVSLFERIAVALEGLLSLAGKNAGTKAADVPAESAPRSKPVRTKPAVTPPADDDVLDEPAKDKAEESLFGDEDEDDAKPVVKYEKKDVRAALVQYEEKKGQDAARKLFAELAGTKDGKPVGYKELTEDKFALIVDRINSELKKK